MQQKIARYFEQCIADEEHARTEGKSRIGQTRIVLQGLLREADIGAIEKRQHVHQQQKRQQPAHDLAVDRL